MQLGPESILVAVRVDFRDDVTAANVERSPLSGLPEVLPVLPRG
jgi:hypothetical protein